MPSGVKVKFVSNLKNVMDKIDKEQKKRAEKVGMELRTEIVDKTLTGNRSGKTYRVPGTNTTYTASAPGEPPAQRTGDLRQSVAYKTKKKLGGYETLVGTPLEYGAHLEFGTKNIKPRPWLKPSFNRKKSELKDLMNGRWF